MPGRSDADARDAQGALDLARGRLAAAGAVVALTGERLDGASRGDGVDDTPERFFADPVAAWRRYDALRARLAAAAPGPAHRALAALEARTPRCTLATFAVDGLHRLAGSRHVLELAGNLWQVRCTRCGLRSVNRDVPIERLPSCPVCTALVRPDVLWAGEPVHREFLVRCHEALGACTVLVVAGMRDAPQPRAGFVTAARRAGAFVVEVGPGARSALPRADVALDGTPDDLLPRLIG